MRTIACLVLGLVACGDDTTGTDGVGASGGSTTSTNIGGAGGSTTVTGGATSSVGGAGGDGGSYEGVDPLAGMGPVSLVKGDFEFTEGPVWFASLGVLRFSDIPANEILTLNGTTVSLWRGDSGGSNGLAVAPGNKIIACEGGARRVSISDVTTPGFTTVIDRYETDRFNAPNDVIVRADGQAYFTDPDYGLPAQDHEIGFNGVYRIDTAGDVSLVANDLVRPNGIALSPDEKTLYVADEGGAALFTFPVAVDGATGAGTKLVDVDHPDGMAVDDAGNLYMTVAAGVQVLKPDGTPWGTIPVAEHPANCTFGGADRKTLYITARKSLYQVSLAIPGKP